MRQLSKCHNAPITVDTADEGTSCFMCAECKRPCDWYYGVWLEQQVTRLELSKRLNQLGVKQESFFYWIKHTTELSVWSREYFECCEYEFGEGKPLEAFEHYSAFIVTELGELLPKGTWLNVFFHSLEVQVQDKGSDSIFTAKNEVDARAKYLIYLLENNLLKL